MLVSIRAISDAVACLGMAKQLLEHVVHGDELDVIWTGLNADEDADDDDEREAQRLHPVTDDME